MVIHSSLSIVYELRLIMNLTFCLFQISDKMAPGPMGFGLAAGFRSYYSQDVARIPGL